MQTAENSRGLIMGLLSKKKTIPTKIASETLDFILETCKSSYPNEFGGLLEAKGDVITDVLYLPGTEATEVSVRVHTYMMPNMSCAGSVHSHPSGAIRPSEADLIFFRSGPVNIIVGSPYGRNDWKAFDPYGNEISIEVVDDELIDEDFDDFGDGTADDQEAE